MKSAIILMVIGAVIFGATFAGWYLLNAFACGMSPTGCTGFSLKWHDGEALQLFVPTFVIGAAIFLFGLWRAVRAKS
ncbi:hypothetical protein CYK37_15050 [Mesorhizobium loti]|nr:hypothetical protein [Mesorhizobium loti]PLP58232.1 hypothetical protein CYK37_15050 [Mesorhizobium loti]